MNEQFRLQLDIERVSEQLGIDCRKFIGFYRYEERQEQGNQQVCERKEGDGSLREGSDLQTDNHRTLNA